jgi:8-oxo-dGTP pyrophosphatase MutT (NUDIX family)
VLLEKRSLNKKYNPGKLGLVGGHVTNDEVPIKTAIIETKEEINLDISNEKIYFIGVAKPDGVYKSFAYQFLVFANPSIKLLKIQEAEVEKLIYVSYKKIYNDVVNGSDNYSLTYPRFKNIFKKINYILKKPS